jgi:nucleotide-binding universal stress UspA family protein
MIKVTAKHEHPTTVTVFEHMTVPVDGSTISDRGVRFALELATGGGRISFCSVVDSEMLCVAEAEGAAIDFGPLITSLDEDAERARQSAAAQAAAAGSLRLERTSRRADPDDRGVLPRN